jgi:hypothetical protein
MKMYLTPLMGILLSLPLGAAAISVVNPSFETDVVSKGNYIGATATGWTGSTLTGFSTFDPDLSQLASGPQNGVNVLALQAGNVVQTLTSFLTANTLYTLQVGVGSRSDGPFISTYDVSLETANGSILADVNSPIPANGTFLTASLNFTALATDPNLGKNLVIRLTNTNPNSVGSQVLYDNVRLSGVSTIASPAPEPSTFLLLSAGAVGLGYRFHRRRPTSHSATL